MNDADDIIKIRNILNTEFNIDNCEVNVNIESFNKMLEYFSLQTLLKNGFKINDMNFPRWYS